MQITDNGKTRIVPDFDSTRTVDINNKPVELDTIYITGGGYVDYAFKGISSESPLGWEEPVWGGSLTRSTDLIMTNIDTVNFGLVARCEFNIEYMDATDYMVLMKMSKERFVTVNYFNRERNERVTQEMAFTGNELKKIYAFKGYTGARGVSIKLVATNREKADLIRTTFNVTFHNNGGSGEISSKEIKWGYLCELPDGSAFSKSGYRLLRWATKDVKGNFSGYYNLNQEITVWNDLNLYAVWEAV